jgi:hypothetical protein
MVMLGAMSQGGISSAATAAGPAPVHITKVNLHSDFARALAKAKHGPIEAKATPHPLPGTHVVKPRPVRSAACTEPNCNLNYAGGSVQHNPKVYLLLWGPGWSGTGADTQYLNSFYSALGSSNDTWSTITSQYTDSTGHPVFSGSVLQGVFQDTSGPVGTDNGAVSSADLTAEADAFVQNQGLSDLGNVQIVIASQSGTCFDDGWVGQPSGCANPGPGPQYCAWHAGSGNGETFTNLPYNPDANGGNGYTCGINYVNGGSAGTYDGYSIVGGHEYAETITDPFPASGWWDSADPYGGEIGDKCAWGGGNWGGNDPIGNVTIGSGTFAMQSLWSNASASCVMSVTPDTVIVANPGNRTGTAGTPVSLQIQATSSGGNPLTYSASGLPSGLTVNTATGLISGTPAGAGTYGVTIGASDITGGSGSTSFTWTISASTLTGQVKGPYGKCLDDTGNLSKNGNKVQIWTCRSSNASQRWTVAASGTGELKHGSYCLDVTGNHTANGTKVQLWNCLNDAAQQWKFMPNGTLQHAGKCLDDPNSSIVDGTQVQIWSCTGKANQRWAKP